MNELYPMKFKPRFKEKIWGGSKMKTVLGMDYSPLPNCGEAWVLSGVPGSETIVTNGFLKGNELNELVGSPCKGWKSGSGTSFFGCSLT